MILDSICSDAIESPFFNDFVKGVAEYGPGYELPSSLTLSALFGWRGEGGEVEGSRVV